MREVIDLRSLAPLETATVLASLRRTNRAVVIHEAWQRGGFGAEVARIIQEQAFDFLDAPVGCVGARNTPKPFSPALERAYLPDAARIGAALRATLQHDTS